jgi:uncharacterized protein YciI
LTDFFIHSRAVPAVPDHDRALDEEHWAYMDPFAAGMVARGPTLGPDRETWTGSIHIVDLPSADAARDFVEREPYNRAGLYDRHLIRRFENRLGRTMWEFTGDAAWPRFLVIADGAPPPALPRERLIVHGDLLMPGDGAPAGTVFALEAPARDAVEGLFVDAEIFDWEFGGRR